MFGISFTKIFATFLCIVTTNAVCTFPANLDGIFDESIKGELTFNVSYISGYKLHTFGTFQLDCYELLTTKYVLKASTSFSYFGLSWDAYFCWDITELTANTFYFYDGSNALTDAGNENVKIYLAGMTPVTSEICAISSNVAGTYRFLLKKGALASAKITCPSELNNYKTYTTQKSGSYECLNNNTWYDGCTDTTLMMYNNTLCSAKNSYSQSGKVYCLYSKTVGSTIYLTTYSTDVTTDDSTTYRYTCHLMDTSTTGIIYSSQHPQKCHGNQTSTYAISPGVVVVYSLNSACTTPTVPPVVSSAWITGVAVVVPLVVILLVILLSLCYYTYRRDAKARARKIIDCRAAEDADTRAKEETEERGKAAPHLRIRFPDYTRKREDRWRKETERDDDRPLSPNGIHFQTKSDRDSPDSAFGSIDDDDELAILRKPKPVSDFMKRLITLHDQKKEAAKERAKMSADVHFRRQQGRQSFKSESEIINSIGPSLLTKIKSMARNHKRRKTTDVYQSENVVKSIAKKDADVGADELDVAADKEYTEWNDREAESVDGDVPQELNVHKLLAYTALAPAATDLKRGSESRRAKNKGVTISDRQNEEIIVEDLEDNVSRKHAGGYVSETLERFKDRSKVFTIDNHEVTPNMKIRTHGHREDEDDVAGHTDNVLQRIHKKPRLAFQFPDIQQIENMSSDAQLRRRLGEDRWRRLLEELYPDKKYMDYAQDTSRPTEDYLFKKTAQGLNYLYNRAEFWDKQEPISRPQTTARCSRAKSSRSVRKSRVSSAGISRHKSLSARQYSQDESEIL